MNVSRTVENTELLEQVAVNPSSSITIAAATIPKLMSMAV
jgi:hypothetical protein